MISFINTATAIPAIGLFLWLVQVPESPWYWTLGAPIGLFFLLQIAMYAVIYVVFLIVWGIEQIRS